MPPAEPDPLFDDIDEAIAAIAEGQPVIVTDDENRENEGDLVMAASKATSESINLMIRHAGGLICVPMIEPQLKRLGLNSMVQVNRERLGTDFTVSVDAAEGISTGISAHDRARTVRILADPEATPEQLVQPGHIFPLRARPGGVLERAGHTEAAVDLATLAGQPPSAVICEILNEDGSCARVPELAKFKEAWGLKMVSIAQLIAYRHRRERLVEEVVQEPLETRFGAFRLHVFRNLVDRRHHFALSRGPLGPEPTLVRVHAENVMRDLFAAGERGADSTLNEALKRIAAADRGVLIYISHPCGGLNLPQHPDSTACALEPVRMDFRGYGLGAQILTALGLRDIRLLTNAPRRIIALDGYGLHIVEQLPLQPGPVAPGA